MKKFNREFGIRERKNKLNSQTVKGLNYPITQQHIRFCLRRADNYLWIG